ncbi:MAG: serine/threonine protein kinase [Polyangiaceae bacterium]|nr:serine/threonine protein kinase [Polyangiaceae bacterium]
MDPGDLVSGKYRLVRRLGMGGMAEVWAATNVLMQRDFAVKFILPALADNAEAVDRFFQEAQAAGRVRHPSIVDVVDVGHGPDGQPFLVMELLAGESLESRLTREGTLGDLVTSVILSQIARALDLAHRAGVVHRDLSSANVFLTTDAQGSEPLPKILDFGVSKILTPGLEARVKTGNGAVLGSPAYMSPEQARGAENVDARTDVWTLGVLMYECLTGRPPFRASNYNALMLAIVAAPHQPVLQKAPRVDVELAGLVESCLVKDREARVQTALEVAEGLEAVARRLSHPGRVGGQKRRATDRLSRDLPRVSIGTLPAGARLPTAAFPVGVRCWQFLTRRAPPGGLMVGGALGGTAVGLAMGVAIAASSAPERRAEAPGVALVDPVHVAEPQGSPAPAPEPTPEADVDLVRATARALGVKKKTAAVPRGVATAVAEAPRKNPY